MTYCGEDLGDETIENIVDEMGEFQVECRDELKSCIEMFLKILSTHKFEIVKMM